MTSELIGCRISITSKAKIRYEGYLQSVDSEAPNEPVITLSKVLQPLQNPERLSLSPPSSAAGLSSIYNFTSPLIRPGPIGSTPPQNSNNISSSLDLLGNLSYTNATQQQSSRRLADNHRQDDGNLLFGAFDSSHNTLLQPIPSNVDAIDKNTNATPSLVADNCASLLDFLDDVDSNSQFKQQHGSAFPGQTRTRGFGGGGRGQPWSSGPRGGGGGGNRYNQGHMFQNQGQNHQQHRRGRFFGRPIRQGTSSQVNRTDNFDSDYDYESANQELAAELQKISLASHASSENDAIIKGGSEASSSIEEPSACYDKNKSFFDSISSEMQDKANGVIPQRGSRREERVLNSTTFGHQHQQQYGFNHSSSNMRPYHNQRYYRGGRGGFYNNHGRGGGFSMSNTNYNNNQRRQPFSSSGGSGPSFNFQSRGGGGNFTLTDANRRPPPLL